VQFRKLRQAKWEHVKVFNSHARQERKTWRNDGKSRWLTQVETSISKWRKISALVMNAGCSTHVKNGLACKDKWSTIISNFFKKNWFHGGHWTKSRKLGHDHPRKK
jgi:hypothetical protein